MEQTFTLAEFLEKKAVGYELPKLKRKAIVQGHCHHKAIMRLKEEKQVMEKMALDFTILESGCCGMAGSFGYEKNKYAVSIKAGERALLPQVRKAGLSTLIVADGFSCKEQIEQQTNRRALHLAEVLAMALENGPHGPGGTYPEEHVIGLRVKAQRQAMKHAGLIIGTALTLAVAFTLVWSKRK